MGPDIEHIVRRLDGLGDTGDSYEAQAELVAIGGEVVPTMARLVPTLTRFGQLSGIEVFEKLRDTRCAPALIDMLTSPHETVREWAALALAELGVSDAVEPVRSAYWECVRRGTPPDWTEAHGLRCALTMLGGRDPVTPPVTARLAVHAPELRSKPAWPSAHLSDVINDLAHNDQVVLFFQCWRLRGRAAYGVESPNVDRETDWAAPWPDLVTAGREWALLEAAEAPIADDILVTISWIAECDLRLA